MSLFWYVYFVLAGVVAIAAFVCCPVAPFGFAAAIVGAWSARIYLDMADEARFF